MKPSTEDKTKGKFHEVKGKIKEEAGKLSMDSKLEAEGKAEKGVGKVQQVIGKVEKVLGREWSDVSCTDTRSTTRLRMRIGRSTEESEPDRDVQQSKGRKLS